MIIGVPKEIKEGEFRVAMIPSNVRVLADAGHQVLVETAAGKAAGYPDEAYAAAGACIVASEAEIWEKAELIVKVKEILPEEFDFVKERHIVFTYIHSANRPPQTECLLQSKCVAFAMEDMKDQNGRFPLLEPMSRIAGEVGMLFGIFYSQTTFGGNGKLVCGTTGVKPMKIVIFGAGNVGLAAARLAVGMRAEVVLMDTSQPALERARTVEVPGVRTCTSNRQNVEEEIRDADLVVNCVKWFPGLTIISRDMLALMKPNAMIVDIDAEPGGAIETSRYSTHEDPVYIVDGIRHIGIPNLPSSAAYSASASLSNVTTPIIKEIADKGWKRAAMENPLIEYGLDFVRGYLTFADTAEAQNRPLTEKAFVYENVD
ncbi:MAG: alanine dehydrogenase [Clostridia bacterium]|nr:alanine dehydrogenase [Clostridia bacterium]